MIAEVCLTYLNFGCIKGLSPALRPLSPAAPFLEYASRYWGAHARRQPSASVISPALKLLDRFDAHTSCELLLREELWKIGIDFDPSFRPMKCTALHAASLLGVLEIMVSLLKANKWDLNATDCFGNTASLWATRKGHDAIVKVLLEEEGVNPHLVDCRGKTSLSWAAEGGHEGIVEMLLKRNDVNPDTVDKYGRTPLSWTAAPMFESWSTKEACERIGEILLEQKDVNPDSADKGGRTPLLWAAEKGREKIVCMLLEQSNVNPDRADKSGRTPFSWAAGNGRERIVRMLLERNDVNPTLQMRTAERHFYGLPRMGARGLYRCCWNGAM